jgi:uncharacterized protein
MSLPVKIALRALRIYKRWLSPMLPVSCRYVPTCSEYAEQAIAVHGVLKGSMLAAQRLLRCHPLAIGGLDPVPAIHTHSYSSNEPRL